MPGVPSASSGSTSLGLKPAICFSGCFLAASWIQPQPRRAPISLALEAFAWSSLDFDCRGMVEEDVDLIDWHENPCAEVDVGRAEILTGDEHVVYWLPAGGLKNNSADFC
jgi:hypothetical protein